jgi:hypothetical protein
LEALRPHLYGGLSKQYAYPATRACVSKDISHKRIIQYSGPRIILGYSIFWNIYFIETFR